MIKLNKIKAEVQDKAGEVWVNTGRRGTLAMATGSGKSKIAVDYVKKSAYKNVLLVVPTTKLRDSDWESEFSKWSAKRAYGRLERLCYASINKVKNKKYDLVILDEAHNITDNNSEFFKNNSVQEVLGLTATPPRDEEKRRLLNSYAPIVFKYTLDEAVKDGVVAPYQIKVIECRLDDKDKYVPAGNKKNPFKTTEKKAYEYISTKISASYYNRTMKPSALKAYQKFLYLQRTRVIYNLRTKQKLADKLIKKIPSKIRCIIFAGSIEQAESFGLPAYHSKSGEKPIEDFVNKKINKLVCVNKLNEGVNIPDLDMAIIIQANSNEKNLIQRIGRVVRYRDGHQAEIIILSTAGTQDEKWVDNALKTFDKEQIEYINIKNL